MRATLGPAFLSSRSFFVPMIFFSVHSIMSALSRRILEGTRQRREIPGLRCPENPGRRLIPLGLAAHGLRQDRVKRNRRLRQSHPNARKKPAATPGQGPREVPAPPARHARPGRPVGRQPALPRPAAPPAVRAPAHAQARRSPARRGGGSWTCRAGFEPHLFEELAWAEPLPGCSARPWWRAQTRPMSPPAFARRASAVAAVLSAAPPEALSRPGPTRGWTRPPGRALVHLHSGQPDAAPRRTLRTARASEERVLRARCAHSRAAAEARARGGGAARAAVRGCPGVVAVGAVPPDEAAVARAGRTAADVAGGGSPSRAAHEAGGGARRAALSPGRGEVCVDLGAAPGGWTSSSVARGARVIAVDPAKLMPELASPQASPHARRAPSPSRPRSRWTGSSATWPGARWRWRSCSPSGAGAVGHALVANIKLPMKDKNPIVFRVRQALTRTAGWRGLTMRQLYHDRDEVTVLRTGGAEPCALRPAAGHLAAGECSDAPRDHARWRGACPCRRDGTHPALRGNSGPSSSSSAWRSSWWPPPSFRSGSR